MRSLKVWLSVFFFVLIATSVALSYFFYSTGGMALVRIVQNYLIPNIPNREYSWNDFIDRGAGYQLSGFYSSSTKDSFSMWTLSGLKTYRPPTLGGQYLYSAICESINTNDDNNKRLPIQEIKSYDFNIWRSYMKKEYFVTVKRNVENPNNIDVIWSMSGKYKRLKVVDPETCK